MATQRLLNQRQSRRQVVGSAIAANVAGVYLASAGSGASAVAAQAPGGHVQAVVTTHEAATNAGLAILEAGGSAADAAVAVASVLTVVEGWFSSVLGGGTWALYYSAESGEVTSVDGVGPTGSWATREDYATRAPALGIHQSNVPGAWDGWMVWLDAYGRLDLGEVLQPAIDLARNGHAASADLAGWAADLDNQILEYPDSARVYAPEGVLPAEGDIIYMDDLANTFESLVAVYNEGLAESRPAGIQAARDYYYRGPIAEAIVAYSNENNGYLAIEDFNGFATSLVEPVSIDYGNGLTVYQNPPNSQGITMLLALNMLKGLELSQYNIDNPNAIHVQVEAMKLAFADRFVHIGDPERVDIPIEALLSDEHAAAQRERIDMQAAITWPIESNLVAQGDVPAHTTTFQVIDSDGNAASVTTSLGAAFLVVGDTGIHMNNRMRMLSVEEGNVNELTPGYKVRHTSCPYLTTRDGRLHILGGNTGVDSQPQGQAQQFLNVVEFGLTADEAINRPRWVSTAFPSSAHDWGYGNQLRIQEGMIDPLLSVLRERGHDIIVGDGTFGSASMVVVNEDGTNAEFGAEPSLPLALGVVIPAG
ncbi:MAG: gamma-glutamyltransferase [Thermomicrobiales bacterium]